MSKLEGGIFSRPRGQTGGLVFGAARTRLGKAVTSRLKVIPSNPRTAGQVSQRNRFTQALDIVRAAAPSWYNAFMNRAVSQLPGFQSMMSVYTKAVQSDDTINPISDIPVGTLHFPDTFTATYNSSTGEVKANWSMETGSNGLNTDDLGFLVVESDGANPGKDRSVAKSLADYGRGDGGSALTIATLPASLTAVQVSLVMYGTNTGANNGLMSIIRTVSATVS